MGHIRLGRLPRTKRWNEVVELIGGSASSAAVASATLDAAEGDLARAASDPGVLRSFYLLTQLPDAARSEDFASALRGLGIDVSASPSTAELSAALSDAIDRHINSTRRRTDLGDMAQSAAVETLASLVSGRTQSLFGSTPDDVRREVSKLATEKQFGTVARDFFARFAQRFLTYYVSRELPQHVGPDRRFGSAAEQRRFNEALDLHCKQASKIVEKFAGTWYSKARFEKDLTEDRTARFVGYALKKMRLELRRGDA